MGNVAHLQASMGRVAVIVGIFVIPRLFVACVSGVLC